MINRLSEDQYEQVLQWLEACKSTLWNFAYAFPHLCSFEELYQDTFLFLASQYPKFSGKSKPISYALASVRMHISQSHIAIRERAIPTVSLDMPITEDGLTLGDLIVADHPIEEDQVLEDQRIQAVHEALRRLPLEDQKYLRRVYELNAFDPTPLYPFHLNAQTYQDVSQHAFRLLRRDTTLSEQLYG